MHTLADPIVHAAAMTPDRLAAVCGDVRLTFAQMYERCRKLANAMSDIGTRSGDRIAILAANSHQYLEYYQGASGCRIRDRPSQHPPRRARVALRAGGRWG